jgi:hypothetical protein
MLTGPSNRVGRICYGYGFVLLLLALLSLPRPAMAAPGKNDGFILGYLTAIVERELQWPRDSYRLEVHGGIATITLPQEDPERIVAVRERIGIVNGLSGIDILTAKAADDEAVPKSFRDKIYEALAVLSEATALPANDLFTPLIADPKEPHFFMSARSYRLSGDSVNIAAVGFGETFGLYRRPGKRPGDGLQLGVSGGLLAQFNLDAPSSDLINADYILGLPITYRHGPWSGRLRLYHQSSHLGDEFLLNTNPNRVNLSYEAVDMLVSYDLNEWRFYGGGEYLINREPEELRPAALHAGLEYRGPTEIWGLGRLIGGLDVKSHEEHDWAVDASLSVGLEFGDPTPGRRNLRLMFDAFRGYAPHGQFYKEQVSYYGLGLGFDF